MLTIGSSTGPSLLDSGALPSSAAGDGERPVRPMNRMRSVSNDGSPTVVPCTVIRCIIHGGCSSAERGRRVQKIAWRLADQFGLHEQLLNAGCATSCACGASTTSA